LNRLDALLYAAAATDDEGRLDLRLAAYVAAMRQLQLAYKGVDMSAWWSARCQIGALAGHVDETMGFKALVPCGRQEKPKAADATEFADPAYRPSLQAVEGALRKYDLIKRGAGDNSPVQSTLTLAR
jgi:hypothetical protein